MAEEEAAASQDVFYHVDPNQNPAAWPGPNRPSAGFVQVHKVDVLYVNVAPSEAGFRMCRTGTNESHQRVLLQVAKHVARGLYDVVNVSISTYSCVVVLTTSMASADMARAGFPWDPPDVELPEVVLK